MTRPSIHFAHANGFPSACYAYLFEQLEDVDIRCVDRLGHGSFALNGNWQNLADEVIDSVEKQFDAPTVGVGHSLGGVLTLLAAARRPELFSHIVLFDAVLFSRRKRFAVSMMRALGLGDEIGPTKRTMVRKATFDSSEQAHHYFAGKSLFAQFHPRCLHDYVTHGLRPAEGGLELVFSPQVEADIFRSLVTRIPKGLSEVKGVMVYGKGSTVLNQNDIRWWQRHLPNIELIPFDGGHLFPFEHPKATAALLRRLID